MSNNKHLKQIKVEGFKSIKKLDLEMKTINILIGANGSGKTNFISLFSFLRNLSEGKLQSYVEANGFASTFFHFSPKVTSRISIDLEVAANGYHVTFEHGSNDDALVFSEEHCTYEGSYRDFTIKGVAGESGLLSGSESDSRFVRDYTRQYLQDCFVYHFHDTSNTASFKRATELSANSYLYPDAGNIAAFLYRLKNSKSKEFNQSYADIVRAVKSVAPFFHDFYLKPQGEEGDQKLLLKWTHRDHDEPFSANQLSDGTARFICMATLFLQPESLRPKTIILDEPELGLHPAALDILADIIKSVSSESQVICSTQSVALANNFKPEDFIVVDQNDGASNFRRLEAKKLESWLDDYGMGDIWSKNLIGGRPEW